MQDSRYRKTSFCQQQQRYPIPPRQGKGEVKCRQIIPLPLGNPPVGRLLPGRPPAKRKETGKDFFLGYKRFFRRVSLETSDYLKDDCLSMHCTVGVVRNRVEGPKQFTISIPPSDMGQNLKYLLETETGCDIAFRIKGETFKGHKLILAARSPVFRAQFFGLVGNPNMDEVELEDIEPSIFKIQIHVQKAMLMFIYSDTLPDSEELSSSMSMCTSTNMIQHLLAAADRFGLDRLKQLCEAQLCEEVNADTVAATLSLADQHRCSQLKAICLKFAAANLG
ncbi:BTB/POZ and MATH domain-containing protein 3 isoform X2, partial [Tanacetum coccineum]